MKTVRLAPSGPVSLATFLIGGPLIYVPVVLAFGGNWWALNPITALGGAMIWTVGLSNPGLWLLTWIPTAVAALICAYLLQRLAATTWYVRANRFGVLTVGAVASGFTSGAVYLACSRIALRTMAVGAAQDKMTSYVASPSTRYPAGVRFAMLGYGVPAVFVIGALLGGGLAWIAYGQNRSQNGDGPKTAN